MVFQGQVDILGEDREEKAVFLGIELALRLLSLFWSRFGTNGHGVDSIAGQKQHAGCKNIIYRIKSCEGFTFLQETSEVPSLPFAMR